jgi:uncharacterized protein YfdQ (DUF2303 family)
MIDSLEMKDNFKLTYNFIIQIQPHENLGEFCLQNFMSLIRK